MTSASPAEANRTSAGSSRKPTAIERLAALAGWRRAVAAFVAGSVSVLAMAPIALWPILFVTLPVLVLLLDGCHAADPTARLRCAAMTGWCFGFGYFVFGLYWIGEAFLVEPGRHAWLLPFAMTGLPAGLALFFALACIFACLLWSPGPARVFALALALGAAEYARGHVLTGLPWNLLGSALTANDGLMQVASLVGVNALSFAAVIIFASPAAILTPFRARAGRSAGSALLGCCLFVLACSWIWGERRLGQAETAHVDGVRLRIVQADISQKDKWAPENQAEILAAYLRLTAEPDGTPPGERATVAVWPETALPILLAQSPNTLAAIAEKLPEGGALIAGSARVEQDVDAQDRLLAERVFNSVFVLDQKATIIDLYDKMHLVPFGEYLPAQDVMESWGIFQLTGVRGGFEPGRGPKVLVVPNAPPAAPLICYEVIFSGAVTQPGLRPGWLVNLTNDAWFGTSAGPYQHFQQARMRAVEEGLPVIRAANTGISGIVDPYGRVVASLGLEKEGVVTGPLPTALPPTLYARYGGWAELIAFVLTAVAWLLFRLLHNESAIESAKSRTPTPHEMLTPR